MGTSTHTDVADEDVVGSDVSTDAVEPADSGCNPAEAESLGLREDGLYIETDVSGASCLFYRFYVEMCALNSISLKKRQIGD